MANLRMLKKEIDYRLEELVFDCDMAICFQPTKEKEINLFEVIQVNDSELWTDRWQKLINDSAFVLFTWMGTGLRCDFLKKASVYMQQQKVTHIFNIMDSGDDLLEYGIEADCKESIQQYFACGGLQNYKNLCLWLSACFCGFEVKY